MTKLNKDDLAIALANRLASRAWSFSPDPARRAIARAIADDRDARRRARRAARRAKI